MESSMLRRDGIRHIELAQGWLKHPRTCWVVIIIVKLRQIFQSSHMCDGMVLGMLTWFQVSWDGPGIRHHQVSWSGMLRWQPACWNGITHEKMALSVLRQPRTCWNGEKWFYQGEIISFRRRISHFQISHPLYHERAKCCLVKQAFCRNEILWRISVRDQKIVHRNKKRLRLEKKP